jgi:hypothetical protein
MGKLTQRLEDASRSGVYRAKRADEIMDAVRGTKLQLVKTPRADMASIAAALDFPDWFGKNWDALEDCLTDLSWREAGGHVLVFEHAQPGDDLGVLIDVLRSSAEFWAGRGKPFFAVFIDPTAQLPLPPLFKEA